MKTFIKHYRKMITCVLCCVVLCYVPIRSDSQLRMLKDFNYCGKQTWGEIVSLCVGYLRTSSSPFTPKIIHTAHTHTHMNFCCLNTHLSASALNTAVRETFLGKGKSYRLCAALPRVRPQRAAVTRSEWRHPCLSDKLRKFVKCW